MTEELLSDPIWQRKTLKKLLFETLKEQRRKRRWNIFFKFLLFIILFGLLFSLWPTTTNLPTASKTKAHISLVDIKGVIADDATASADNVIEGLQNAFEDKHTSAVILRINSPGGSPVQAAQIYNEIRYLRHLHQDHYGIRT